METKAQPIKQKKLTFILVAIVMIAVFISTFNIVSNSSLNYAEETARPLESSLVELGGIKLSGGGDPGRGPDNIEPYYDATYRFDLDETQVTARINKAAKDNGYKLIHASPENRGHLGAVGDIYIDKWYFDNDSKESPFKDLSRGHIELAFEIGDEDDTNDASPTVVRVNVQLPSFRK